MKYNAGFTLLELMVVIGIMAILSAIAAPNVSGWRAGHLLSGATSNFRNNFGLAKQEAISKNAKVILQLTANSYTAFEDNGAGGGTANDSIQNGSEPVVYSRSLPARVAFDLAGSTYANNRLIIQGNGRCTAGTITITNSIGTQRNFTTNITGHCNIQ